jgi:single-stranded-DNA-specific exonuclease
MVARRVLRISTARKVSCDKVGTNGSRPLAAGSPTAHDRRAMVRAFFDVTRSLTGRAWRDRLDARRRATAESIRQRHALSEILARVLAGRGAGLEDVPRLLEPSLRRDMPDPSRLTDMDAASDRLAEAVIRAEQVAIFGDYDVDGATSTALMARFLADRGAKPDIYIPDRIFEGYGPTVEAVRTLAARGATLLVTVDCGTASHVPFDEARRLGLDVVVIDHHQADAELPAVTALVNPNRHDDVSGEGHLAACGLVFLVLVATSRALRQKGFFAGRAEPDLMALTDLVALGTVADVVPLRGLNRAYVARGLQVMRRRERPGLVALMDAARLAEPPEPWHLGFLIGPRINAGGRIGRADLGARLLLEDDPLAAARIAAELDRLNRERQQIEATALAEAMAEAETAHGADGEGGSVIVTAAADWHPGVVGLVAARLMQRFGRPAFAIALEPGGTGTGSGRSIVGVDLGRAVRRAVAEGVLIKGGGHAMAAGVTVPAGGLTRLRAFLDDALAADIAEARRERALPIDAASTAPGATPSLVAELERAGPFGAGWPEPVIAFGAHRVVHADVVGTGHVRLKLGAGDGPPLSAVAFRVAEESFGRALLARRGALLHVAGSLAIDRWQGRERVDLRVIDAAVPDSRV